MAENILKIELSDGRYFVVQIDDAKIPIDDDSNLEQELMDRIVKDIHYAAGSPLKYEQVVQPQHYGGDEPYEVLKVLFAWGIGIPFCFGCAMKYIRRNGEKPGVDGYTDIEKASYYLKRAAEEMKRIQDEATT